jgi:phosphoribosylamine--glycine ligase
MNGMKVLVVGNGAREHAIAKALAKSEVELISAMARRNPGIAGLSKETVIMDINDTRLYKRFNSVDLAFIGPEAPLAAGVTDALNKMEIPVVGPTKAAARLEWSKAYTREFLDEQGVPGNPDFAVCRSKTEIQEFLSGHPDIAVKPDVLTGGKGVKITGEHLHGAREVVEYHRP